MAFDSPVKYTASLACLEQDKRIPSNLSPKVLIVASYRSGLRLRFSNCGMHTRNKGDMLHAGNAPLAAAIIPLDTAWFSPAPCFRADMSTLVNPFCFLDTKRTRMARFDVYQPLRRKNMARVRRGPGGKAGADAAIVAKLEEGNEHPATKASDEDLKKIVKWILAR
jgi:hypothetical protein